MRPLVPLPLAPCRLSHIRRTHHAPVCQDAPHSPRTVGTVFATIGQTWEIAMIPKPERDALRAFAIIAACWLVTTLCVAFVCYWS